MLTAIWIYLTAQAVTCLFKSVGFATKHEGAIAVLVFFEFVFVCIAARAVYLIA